MAAITNAGISTGLDVENLVTSLMAIERRPITMLQQRQQTFEAQLSSFGRVKSALSTFKTALTDLGTVSKFQVFSATSSSDAIFTASTSESAAAGTHTIKFDDNGVHKLATKHRLNSTVAVANATTSIGATGTLRIQLGATDYFDIAISGANNTLNGIRDAINNDADNVGVTATVINTGSSSKLLLTSNETGASNTITLSNQGGGNVATVLGMTDGGVSPQDAVVTIDGFAVTSASNSISTAIDGVTINLKALDEAGATQTLTITRDTAAVTKSVQAFVDAYNKLRAALSKERTSSLKGDSALLSIESRIRSVMNTVPSGIDSMYNYLSEIGITTQEGGDLKLDTTKLTTALGKDYAGVSQMMANDDQGYLYRLKSTVTDFLSTGGLIDAKEDGLDARIDSLEDQQARYEYRMDLIERRYRDQFTALDALVGTMQSTSAFLTAQLS